MHQLSLPSEIVMEYYFPRLGYRRLTFTGTFSFVLWLVSCCCVFLISVCILLSEWHVGQKTTWRNPFSPSCGSQGLQPGGQVSWQALVPIESSCQLDEVLGRTEEQRILHSLQSVVSQDLNLLKNHVNELGSPSFLSEAVTWLQP